MEGNQNLPTMAANQTPSIPEIKSLTAVDDSSPAMEEENANNKIFPSGDTLIDEEIAAVLEVEEYDETDKKIDSTSAGEEIKPKMTQEEMEQKAYELQKKIRQERLLREKKEAIERERNRISSSKMMQEQVSKLEEASRKRAIQQMQKEKEEHEKERQRQLELMRNDWRERFGTEYVEETPAVNDAVKENESRSLKSKREVVASCCNRIYSTYKNKNDEGLKKCLTTLKAYMRNICENPTETKYHRLKLENEVFKTKVSSFDGSIALLNSVGFKEAAGGGFLEIEGAPDVFLISNALKYLDLLLSRF